MATEDLRRRKTVSRIGNTRVTEYSGLPSQGIAPRMELEPIREYRMAKPKAKPPALPKPERPKVEEPTYFTRENSKLGWQERIARNRELAENYRAALSSGTQQYSTDVQGVSSASTAALRNQGDLAVRRMQERGLGSRQEAQITHEAALQRGRQAAAAGERSFLREQAEADRAFRGGQAEAERTFGLRRQREAAVPGLLAGGNIEGPAQAELYTRHGPGSVYGLKPTPDKGPRFKYIAPTVTTDLEGNPQIATPAGAFDPTIGITKYEAPVLDTLLEDSSPEDQDALLEELLKRKSKRE